MLVVGFSSCLSAQNQVLRLMTYNVENLFDTCRDERIADEEFLPGSERQWTSLRYWKKVGQISRVIAAAGGLTPIDIVVLCEVENDSVLRDLTERTRLNRFGYRFLSTSSHDLRGLDVALLYQPLRFKILSCISLPVPFRQDKERPTRDVLYVTGRTFSGDTLDIFACHFPSRRGGANSTSAYRERAANVVRHAADSVLRLRVNPSVVIMGDFNDEPRERSFVRGMKAVGVSKLSEKPSARYVILSDTLTAYDGQIQGTYRFKGRWNRLDHVVVNREMIGRSSGLRYAKGGCRILAFPFLLEKTSGDNPVLQLNRTYLGSYYHGGTSDHLPLILELVIDL